MSKSLLCSTASLSDVLAVDRRRFLGFAGGLAAASAAGCVGTDSPGVDLRDMAPGKSDNLVFENGVCVSGATGTDALGPYWTPNIRDTIRLAAADIPGQRMVIVGHVYASDCETPVVGAQVVAWQADDDGLYDYNHAGLNQGTGDGTLTEAQTRLRGMTTASVSGTYAFETIFPREYPLNLLDPANSAFRAPHVHFAVFHTDKLGNSHQLVTQMYFSPTTLVLERTPNLDQLNANDGGASSAESSRFIDIEGSGRDLWHGQFDIVLDLDPASA